jgi:hypothetical protein
MVSHAAFEFAVHAHSRAVVTASVPLPPDAGTVRSVAPIVTPQRGTVAGAVDVDVVVDEPHAAAAIARAMAIRIRERTKARAGEGVRVVKKCTVTRR